MNVSVFIPYSQINLHIKVNPRRDRSKCPLSQDGNWVWNQHAHKRADVDFILARPLWLSQHRSSTALKDHHRLGCNGGWAGLPCGPSLWALLTGKQTLPHGCIYRKESCPPLEVLLELAMACCAEPKFQRNLTR